jgi:hypothetical protein
VTGLRCGRSGVRIPLRTKDIFSETSTWALGPTQLRINRSRGSFEEKRSRSVKLLAHLHLMLWLRLIGPTGLPLYPLYANMAWTRAALPLLRISYYGICTGHMERQQMECADRSTTGNVQPITGHEGPHGE